MKIIDEKGRLFGKINVIDFLIIVFLTPMLYFGYRLYEGNKKAAAELQQKAANQAPAHRENISKDNTQIETKPTPEENVETKTELLSKSQLGELRNKITTLENTIILLGSRITILEKLKGRIDRLEEELNIILSSPKIKKMIQIKE